MIFKSGKAFLQDVILPIFRSASVQGMIFGTILLYPVSLFGQDVFITSSLEKEVEILVDHWGIPHIYADHEHDLFFAQGFYAAMDRTFQFEIWRRQATGTVAEILGPRELNRDIGTRLFQFRGDLQAELNHYHPRGEQIIRAFVNGVNAFIELTESRPEMLSVEFELLGIKPQRWTPDIVISRHQGLLGNIGRELSTGRLVSLIGPEKALQLSWFHPQTPDLTIDPKINSSELFDDILKFYNAFRRPVRFQPNDLIADAQNDWNTYRDMASIDDDDLEALLKEEYLAIGSNNWIVSGEHTQSGYPVMANDPHRTLAAPSLRYMSHLIAPGWNVIGGGEPEIPGISIGHNDHGAWGLTVFRTDAEDLYVYETNPDNPDQYQYKGQWEDMKIISDRIPVKGQRPVDVTYKYTRHGPVVHEDGEAHIAYAVRCGWLEVGGSPYLASLRMDQAENFEEFREACNYSNIPGENMIWADHAGNIGWQAVGIAPIRRNWSGLVPVPGDGTYEWDNYLEIKQKPHIYNPASGIFITANENVISPEYTEWDAIGFSWSDPFRGDRLAELLCTGRKHTLMDMAKYQTDYLSIPARTLAPLLEYIDFKEEFVSGIKDLLLDWDYRLEANSIAAGIYVEWEKQLRNSMTELLVAEEAESYYSLQMKKCIDFLLFPDAKFGSEPVAGRDTFLSKAFIDAISNLQTRLGNDMSKWQYGQLKYKHVLIKHPLSNAVNDSLRQILEVGPVPRGGNAYVPGSTSNANNQRSGASFRIIVDTGDWDQCLAMNSPGQSGDPDHPNYRNLFEMWAQDRFFPLFYSREKVESVSRQKILLKPAP